MKKTIMAITIAAVLLILNMLPVFADGNTLPLNYIMDNAGLLTAAEISDLNEKAMAVSEEYGFPVFVVTTPDIKGMVPAEYTEELYDSLGVGTGIDRSGVMLLVSMADRDVVLFTRGYGNTVFTDYRKEMLEGDYIGALSAARYHESFAAYIAGCDRYLRITKDGETLDGVEIAALSLISVAVPLIPSYLFCRYKAKKMKTAVRQRAARVYVVDGSFELTRSSDVYTHTTETRTKIASSSSGGRSGGGTSVSRSGSSSRSSKF